jgi:hypothetical protein
MNLMIGTLLYRCFKGKDTISHTNGTNKNIKNRITIFQERSRDLMVAGDYCENMATELTAIAASSNSAGQILKSVDSHGTPFLDVLIDNSINS